MSARTYTPRFSILWGEKNKTITKSCSFPLHPEAAEEVSEGSDLLWKESHPRLPPRFLSPSQGLAAQLFVLLSARSHQPGWATERKASLLAFTDPAPLREGTKLVSLLSAYLPVAGLS